jgi:anaerobic selenocysteine-containing dehydrogenase
LTQFEFGTHTRQPMNRDEIATQTVDPSIARAPLALDADDLPTVCVLCSHNCGIRIDVKGGRITAVRADERNPITNG